MNVKIADLVKALPDIEADEADDVAAVLSNVSQRPLPTGSLHRLSLLGGLQAKIAVAYLMYWLRGFFKSTASREADLQETHLRAALKLLDRMGYMRGAVMKIGQTLANFPDIVPDGLVETLEKLHFQAPPMHFSLLREMVVNELGDDPENLFAEFEETAFAAASLGQVHRARLKSGQRVAVKIQYPGIARTIRTDFKNLIPMLMPARLTGDWQNLKRQVESLRQHLQRETDYRFEAETQSRIERLFHEEDQIVVPRVHPEFSTERVLTMDYLEGVHLGEFLQRRPSQVERNGYAERILRASCRMLYRERIQNVDWHPGNFLFMPQGRLGLLDFGCIVDYGRDDVWQLCERLHIAMRTGNPDYVRAGMREWCQLQADDTGQKEQLDDYTRYALWSWCPIYTPGEWDYGDREYLDQGVQLFSEMVKKRYTRNHPVGLSQTRWEFGYWMLMYRLGAKIDGDPILREEVQATGWDLSRFDRAE